VKFVTVISQNIITLHISWICFKGCISSCYWDIHFKWLSQQKISFVNIGKFWNIMVVSTYILPSLNKGEDLDTISLRSMFVLGGLKYTSLSLSWLILCTGCVPGIVHLKKKKDASLLSTTNKNNSFKLQRCVLVRL
jgi:hypothetical protein